MNDPNRKECSYSEKPNNRQAAISEKKMQIVINNYFKSECNVNTSIRQAFEKGFRIGVKKGLAVQPERKKGSWNVIQGDIVVCSECGMSAPKSMTGCLVNRHLEPNRTNFCPNCGKRMGGEQDE